MGGTGMTEAPRTLFVNARVETADASLPEADAFLVEGEDLAWVGRAADAPARPCDMADEVVDLGGARVVPGFVDAHMHAVTLANCAGKIAVLPPAITSISELADAVARRRAEQGPGSWVEGWGYDESLLAEHRSPTRWDLDAACPDAPVCITRVCEHIRCVNSRALELAGVTRDTPDPPGGRIVRDADGEPTGVLEETARDLVTPVLPVRSREDAVRSVLELGRLLASQGVVAMTDMASLDGTDVHPVLVAAAARGLAQDACDYALWDQVRDDPWQVVADGAADRGRQVFCAGVKLLTDGSVSGGTAWFDEPYLPRAGEAPDPARIGMPTCPDEDIAAAAAFCREAGLQLSLHAMGTRAIDRAARMLASAGPWDAGDRPWARIEHVTAPSADAIRLMAQAGIAVATQPIFPYAEMATYLARLGADRTSRCYPIRSLIDAGVAVCLSTDAPATSWATASDPFPTLKAAVGRRSADGTDFGAGEALTIREAVALYTREAARVAGFERLGMIRTGYKASFVVLDRDLMATPVDEIDKVGIAATYIRGKKVFG